MPMKALYPLAGLLACLAASQASAALTKTAIDEKPMSLTWNITWDRSFTSAGLAGPAPMKYWISSFAVVSLDGDRVFNDIAVQVKHRALGPKEVELVDHNDAQPYTFHLSNALGKLNAPFGVTRNVPGSVLSVAHKGGTQVDHRDDVRLEYKLRDGAVDFQLNAVHVDSPVPEPAAWGLLMAGLATLGLARRQRR